MSAITVSGVKAKARLLINHFEKSGISISLAQALEAVSAADNGTDWNRYRSSLKSAAGAPTVDPGHKHKIIVRSPGTGTNAVLHSLFGYELLHTDGLPIFIELLKDNKMGRCYLEQSIEAANGEVPAEGLETLNFMYCPDHPTKFPCVSDVERTKGIIIRFWVDPTLSAEQYRDLNACALRWTLRQILAMDKRILQKISTVFVNNLEYVDTSNSCLYDRHFPAFMRDLRAYGGNKQLVICTSSDQGKKSLYRSADEYKLIKMLTPTLDLFADCPFDCINVRSQSNSSLIASIYDRLFTDDTRVVEDTALYLGQLRVQALETPFESKIPTAEFIRNFCLKDIEISKKRQMGDERWKILNNITLWFTGGVVPSSEIDKLANRQRLLYARRIFGSKDFDLIQLEVRDEAAYFKYLPALEAYCSALGIEIHVDFIKPRPANVWVERATAVLNRLNNALTMKFGDVSSERLEEYMTLVKMSQLILDQNIDEHLRDSVLQYLKDLPEFDLYETLRGNPHPETVRQHHFVTMHFDEVVSKLKLDA
jgi:hypothetical protein